MYRYTAEERELLQQRVAQFRRQTQLYLDGQLSEEEFRPLRLQNGLYIQRLAPMLRVSIPYGMLSALQLRTLAHIARHYDKGYGHFSTRQNIQFNWPHLEQTPDILQELAQVEMHAIQTSGNCIRNITTDQFAGIAPDELEDPRPWCELVRQWACLHPEFAFLPRKFKIAINGAKSDRAATYFHDIGLNLVHDAKGETGFQVLVGGGMGRTPTIGAEVREFLPAAELFSYLEAILRVYNLLGRRDNIHKARIKILLRAWGAEELRRRVEDEWEETRKTASRLLPEEVERLRSFFSAPAYREIDLQAASHQNSQLALEEPEFAHWKEHNVAPHRMPGYCMVSLSLKRTGIPPGDLSDEEMEWVADLAERFSFGEIRTTREQNLVLGDVAQDQLGELWQALRPWGLATPNIGTLNDIVCCPGGDYCSLANARSIPVAEAIQRRFEELDYLYDLGEIDLYISGCMNACGHHHIGNIGVLGVDKKGREFFQVSVGGASGEGRAPAIGTILGPSFAEHEVADAVAAILEHFVQERSPGEEFCDTLERLGIEVFREHVYAPLH